MSDRNNASLIRGEKKSTDELICWEKKKKNVLFL